MAMLRHNHIKSVRAAALAILLAGLAFVAPVAGFAQDFPKLTGRVTDAASIIPAEDEALLTQKLEALEQQSQRQLVIATVPSLGGYDIADYGYRLGREWGIGDKERNDGALLIVAPKERKVRIEVGYGLEPVLTDGLSWMIINNEIVPRFKQGDMPAGIMAGADAIITQLTLPPEEAQKIAAQAQKAQESTSSSGILPMLLFNGFFLFFFIIPLLRAIFGRKSGKRHRGSRLGPIIWAPGGFSGGGGRSGGGFSGGFSGGGGSFGGGGASGGW